MASVLGIIHSHILTGWPTPLIELLGPLTGLVAALYLPSRAVQARLLDCRLVTVDERLFRGVARLGVAVRPRELRKP